MLRAACPAVAVRSNIVPITSSPPDGRNYTHASKNTRLASFDFAKQAEPIAC